VTGPATLSGPERLKLVRDRHDIRPLRAAELTLLRLEQAEPSDAVPTFLESWNHCCRGEGAGIGLARGWNVQIGGATGAGKTLFALNLTIAALKAGEQVLYITLEMSWSQLVTRLRAIATGTDIRLLEWGEQFSEPAAKEADAALVALPGTLYYNRRPAWRLEDVRELMQLYAQQKNVRFFVVDYLQLVSPGGTERIYEAVTKVSQQLRFAALELNAVCVAVSQYNRATSANRTDRPIVQGLAGGSSIENDADQVILLDHTRRKRNEHERTERTYALLAKNRHGPQGELGIEFDYRTLRVREALPDEEEGWL
jgi:replicative DNA helicase